MATTRSKSDDLGMDHDAQISHSVVHLLLRGLRVAGFHGAATVYTCMASVIDLLGKRSGDLIEQHM